jgi:hypothetical protein
MSAGRERNALERELQAAPLPENATVRVGDAVPDPPQDPLLVERGADGSSLVASRNCFQITISGVATFEVTGGSDVLLVPDPGCEAADVAPYLEGTVAAVLLAQRGSFALHANAVRIAGSVVAICGPPGAGKSTTAMRLVQGGHVLLADDLCPLELTEAGVLLHGTGRRPRVTPETVARLGLDLLSSAVQTVDGKLLLPELSRASERLDLIVDLGLGEASADVGVSDLKGLEALAAVERNAYLTGVLQALWRGQLLEWAARVSKAVPVLELRRPEGSPSFAEVAAEIEASLERLAGT